MSASEFEDKELIQKISDQNFIDNLSHGRTQDVLSIVYDAINSTVGGVIITDLKLDRPVFYNRLILLDLTLLTTFLA